MTRIDSDSLRDILKLYFIMGSTNCYKSPASVLKDAIAGGITLFQFREKGIDALTGDAKFALAEELQTICKEHGIPFIVNDDIDLAISLEADGVHIGQEDAPVDEVRKRIGDKILGVSVHTMEEALTAMEAGADYFGVGPIFPTKTKEDAKPVQGVQHIQHFREKGITIPMVGIGGITMENALKVMKAGADGVSVITAISKATDITKAAQRLREQVEY
ncbi:thiamine-phosphate pyrophosphorylase [Heyndrickxia shackletonii]|uniref:Thiamine-phosphate synthase n=1 Tax=Heyndrickxia shackletonii TaxID=157838 RepID=A0A0Q3WRY7_9BACI|nr:thiamine phosphate synthase [Heyndrickxia shackletonii]KQL50373.1 thiamine-phosphate pyrophosphorylase [Heyndrickxia shackletonii]NEZ00829.1 thiamine phosphate synthase [Heyndrickxia shackletonii]